MYHQYSMSQYGAPKPPVWGSRATGAETFASGLQGAGGLYAAAAANQLSMSLNGALNPGVMNLGSMVNQAAFGSQMQGLGLVGINSLAAAAAHQQHQHQQQQQQQRAAPQVHAAPQVAQQATVMAPKNQRTFVGRVTKMQDNYGFVDDDVFFQANVVRGAMPRVGDRVMVEASYNAAMPFKWNAFRVQVMNDGPTQPSPTNFAAVPTGVGSAIAGNAAIGAGMGSYSQQPKPTVPSHRDAPPSRQSNWSQPESRSSGSVRLRTPPRRHSPPRRQTPRRSPPPRRLSPRELRDDRKRERERTPTTRTSSAVPSVRRDSASPPRRRQRIIPRYVVAIPKSVPTGLLSAGNLRKRYEKLYIPSDFCDIRIDWSSVSPALFPDLSQPALYHVLNKEVDPLVEIPELEPSDSDHRYQVLLLAHAGRTAINQKTYGLSKDGNLDDTYDPTDFFKNVGLLCGTRNKELVPLGGSYSVSLDGPNPLSLATMIRTAVRCTKALTGIDLSKVSQWFQLGQLRYFRADKERADRVTLLLPTTGDLALSEADFAAACDALRAQLNAKIAALDAPDEDPAAATTTTTTQSTTNAAVTVAAAATVTGQEAADAATADAMDEAEEPTHWSKLDVKTMKVIELRSELAARGVDSKGSKTILAQRLDEIVEKEKEADGGVVPEALRDPPKPEATTEDYREGIKPPEETEEQRKAREEEERKKKEAADKARAEKKAQLEKKYTLPAESRIFAFPNREFKGGKFDCRVISLKSLLDYRSDDNKEHQFEGSLYVEAVREMFERHAAYTVTATLALAAERDDERKRREEAYKDDNTDAATEASDGTDAKDDTAEKEKPEKKLELKVLIGNIKAFEAFAFFDVNLLGYLQESDIEEIITNASLGIPRSIVKKLIAKYAIREKLNYRALTDSLADKTDTGSSIVVINGTVINVNQKLEEIKRLDAEKEAAVVKYAQAETTIKTLKEARDHLERRKSRLTEDVERYRRKAHDAERSLKNAHDDGVGARIALLDAKKIAERLLDTIARGIPDEKKKDSKKETSADTKPTVENGTKTLTSTAAPPAEDDDMILDQMELADSVGEDASAEKREDEPSDSKVEAQADEQQLNSVSEQTEIVEVNGSTTTDA